MFKENYIINGIIKCETGLHIGGSNDTVEIGGSDNVIIRTSIDNKPFIPGSSLKGKLRSLIELNDAKFVEALIQKTKNNSNDIVTSDIAVKIFGGSAEDETLEFPTRLIVRDSYPTESTVKLWNKYDSVVDGAELKYENTLNRLNASAMPRNIERVPKGSEFEFEMIFSVYDESSDVKETLPMILNAMFLLEDNYLGGSGSRGFGQVKFKNINITKRDKEFYKGNNDGEILVDSEDLLEARKELSKNL